MFNMKKCASESAAGTKERNSLNREPPLPIYIGLNIHQQTSCKKLIMQFYSMGISISYDRVLDLKDRIVMLVYEQCEEDGPELYHPPASRKNCLLWAPLIIWIIIHPQQFFNPIFM